MLLWKVVDPSDTDIKGRTGVSAPDSTHGSR